MAATSPSQLAIACLLTLLLTLLSPPTMAEQVLLDTGTLQAGRTLFNKDREFRFIMQWNCDLVLYEVSTTVWHTNTVGHGSTCQARLSASGNLVVVRGDGQVVWSSPAPVATPYYTLAVQSDRNVVIYSRLAWSTESPIADAGHRSTDQILLQDNTLRIGEFLANADLNYQFLMQANCELALYDAGRRIWSSGTAGKGTGCTATLTVDGQLVIRDGSGSFVAGTGKRPPSSGNYALLLLPDRRAVVAYAPVWATGTSMPSLADGLSSNSSSLENVAAAGKQAAIKGRMYDAAGNVMNQMVAAGEA